MKNNKLYWITLWDIFIASLKIAFLSFGGGNAVMGVIHQEFVKRNKWVEDEEFSRLIILANILPGPMIMKICVFIANKAAGTLGAFVCFVTILFPAPLLLALFLSFLYQYVAEATILKISKSIIPAVMAMLFAFTWELFKKDKQKSQNWLLYGAIFLLVFITIFFKVSIILIFSVLIVLLAIFKVK